MIKSALRQELTMKRQALGDDLNQKKSEAILEKLNQLPEYKDAQSILFYVSLPKEVDTHSAITQALKQGKTVFVPRTNAHELTLHRIHDLKELKPGSFGVLEPDLEDEWGPSETMDLIVVPGLGFDRRGHRIGYGKGHYDRLLKRTRGYKVGLAFEEQIIDEVPDEEHDVPLDCLITDAQILRFHSPLL